TEALKLLNTKIKHEIYLVNNVTALYKSLYNLLIKELNILYKYFKKMQMKN
ncbi:hypothetical protein AJ78_08566, partial [Emergomyces pasteurianus Ep9510]